MSTLHTVNKSPFATNALQSALAHCKDGDAVLMIEDGVYGALSGTALTQIIEDKAGAVSIFALTPDVDARGLAADKMIAGVEGVDYAGFVDLVTKHDRTQSWL